MTELNQSTEKYLIKTLNEIQNRLINIENDIKVIKQSVEKMDSHVDFVNGVYDNVKVGFHNIISLADRIPRPFYSGLIEPNNERNDNLDSISHENYSNTSYNQITGNCQLD